MSIGKDQAITLGEFYSTSDKNVIYRCSLNNTRGFLKDITIFSLIIGFFCLFIVQWFTLVVVPLSWIIIIPWLIPKHYRFLQLKKHTLTFGRGSIVVLIKSRIKTMLKLEKNRYKDIHYLRLDRWQRKKLGGKMDSFGRIEIKIDDIKPIFFMLIETTDLIRLVKILETLQFDFKVQKRRLHGELMLIFPSSPHYSNIK